MQQAYQLVGSLGPSLGNHLPEALARLGKTAWFRAHQQGFRSPLRLRLGHGGGRLFHQRHLPPHLAAENQGYAPHAQAIPGIQNATGATLSVEHHRLPFGGDKRKGTAAPLDDHVAFRYAWPSHHHVVTGARTHGNLALLQPVR
jgi:hypothetical protein